MELFGDDFGLKKARGEDNFARRCGLLQDGIG